MRNKYKSLQPHWTRRDYQKEFSFNCAVLLTRTSTCNRTVFFIFSLINSLVFTVKIFSLQQFFFLHHQEKNKDYFTNLLVVCLMLLALSFLLMFSFDGCGAFVFNVSLFFSINRFQSVLIRITLFLFVFLLRRHLLLFSSFFFADQIDQVQIMSRSKIYFAENSVVVNEIFITYV